MPFPGEGVWLVNWLGNWVLEKGIGGIPYSTYKNTPYRLEKSRSALAEARLTMFTLIDIWYYMNIDNELF